MDLGAAGQNFCRWDWSPQASRLRVDIKGGELGWLDLTRPWLSSETANSSRRGSLSLWSSLPACLPYSLLHRSPWLRHCVAKAWPKMPSCIYVCVCIYANIMYLFLAYLKGRERERSIFPLLIHSPNACNSQDTARPKPGAWNSIQSPTVGGGDSVIEAITSARLPRPPQGVHRQEAGSEVEELGLELDLAVRRKCPAHMTPAPVPRLTQAMPWETLPGGFSLSFLHVVVRMCGVVRRKELQSLLHGPSPSLYITCTMYTRTFTNVPARQRKQDMGCGGGGGRGARASASSFQIAVSILKSGSDLNSERSFHFIFYRAAEVPTAHSQYRYTPHCGLIFNCFSFDF
nr:uncharacterized protein LOC127487274 [Oryctolagus cuniculus]